VLDDFGLVPMAETHQPLLLELLEDRHQRGSVLVTSQLPIKFWHGQFKDPTLADAILDRLVHNAEMIELPASRCAKNGSNQPSATIKEGRQTRLKNTTLKWLLAAVLNCTLMAAEFCALSPSSRLRCVFRPIVTGGFAKA